MSEKVSVVEVGIASVGSVAVAWVTAQISDAGALVAAAVSPPILTAVTEALRSLTNPERSFRTKIAIASGLIGIVLGILLLTGIEFARGESADGKRETTLFGGKPRESSIFGGSGQGGDGQGGDGQGESRRTATEPPGAACRATVPTPPGALEAAPGSSSEPMILTLAAENCARELKLAPLPPADAFQLNPVSPECSNLGRGEACEISVSFTAAPDAEPGTTQMRRVTLQLLNHNETPAAATDIDLTGSVR